MNELEKTVPANGSAEIQNATEATVSSVCAEATETIPAETATAETADAPVSEQPEEETEAAERNEGHKYFEMTKSELTEALAAIVEAKEADRHKEVAAIKQAFYILRNAELEAEAIRFAEEAQPGDSFVSATDPDEVRFKDLGSPRSARCATRGSRPKRKGVSTTWRRRTRSLTSSRLSQPT